MSVPPVFERGMTVLEVLVTLAILIVGLFAGASLIVSSHPSERTRASSQLLGALDRVHAIAATNGATLQIAPAGKGSILRLLDGFLSGNVVESVSTDMPVALRYSGGLSESAQLAIRRDGSWYPVVNNAEQACDGSEALGFIGPALGSSTTAASFGPQAQAIQLGESYQLSCVDMHISVAQ